ncbi:tryparedoxin, putative [Leishmania tarentolae]|uniref:Tryparedoxin, putative n=1 Tax=Leishmania tarentolae TaxID=5689 RepID=A0A640KPL9_LEITA|nr:tryparedoxin, putative [Leishmania tarentolae]
MASHAVLPRERLFSTPPEQRHNKVQTQSVSFCRCTSPPPFASSVRLLLYVSSFFAKTRTRTYGMEPNFFNNSKLMLLCKDGSAVRAIDILKDAEYVLMYFSAHWCPPCRSFTPLLKDFYEKHHDKKKFEVVFMSFDESEGEMMRYFRESHGPYYCLPYADAKSMTRVWRDTYNVKTIPALLVFENSNPRKLIARCGRDMVINDPSADGFPWPDADAQRPAESFTLEYISKAVILLCILFFFYSLISSSL